MALESLLIQPGESPVPTADKQNAILAHLLANRFAGVVDGLRSPKGFPHPFRVTVSRMDEAREGMTLPAGRTWRIDIAPGAINDILPAIPFRKQGDKRGWKLPVGYVAKSTEDWIDRDALDDHDDPPFLAVVAPKPGEKKTSDFRIVPDAERPDAFCGAAEWELELWSCHVLLSASPLRSEVMSAAFPPPRLARYRFYTAQQLPSPTFGARSGGWFEVATLYYLRDPAAPELAEMFVRQREFWPMWAVIVQPGSDIPATVRYDPLNVQTGLPLSDAFLAAGDAANQAIADAALQQLESTLEGATSVEAWTA